MGKKMSIKFCHNVSVVAASVTLSLGIAPFRVSAADSSTDQSAPLSEIIVTAEKKSERLQDVPVPVAVLNADALASRGDVLLRDYAIEVPGLSVTPNYIGLQTVAIRGITTGGLANPTVAMTVDDIPFSGVLMNTVPDLDPGDLSQVEVLRGPQGTLYGASSMGGLIRYVTRDPSTDGVSGRVESTASGVDHGGQMGFSLRGSINVPVSDTLAVRASAFSRQDPGYIDNTLTHEDGINVIRADGGRVSALWKPTDSFSWKLSGFYQTLKQDGLDEALIGPGFGLFQQNYIAGAGQSQVTTQGYSSVLKYNLDKIQFTASTGYSTSKTYTTLDSTPDLGGLIEKYFGAGVTGALFSSLEYTKKFSQELRADITLIPHLDLLVGGFYGQESVDPQIDSYHAEDTRTGDIVGTAFSYVAPLKYSEYAAFANMTYHFSDRFDLQVGGRESRVKVTNGVSITTGPFNVDFGLPPILLSPELSTTQNVSTYLFAPRFRFNEALMVYARVSSGYRPGAPNEPLAPTRQSQADKTKNYEVGLKGDFFDHVVQIDASVYYIDWSGIQLSVSIPNYGGSVYSVNGGGAKSKGIELTGILNPGGGLTVKSWVAYDKATLTDDFPVNSSSDPVGLKGDRLPNSPEFSASVSANQDFQISSQLKGFASVTANYVGSRVGQFTQTDSRQDFGAYTRVDASVGIKSDDWTAKIYANNLNNSRAILDGGIGYFNPDARIYITPRTLGVSLSKQF
jgi:iron complex outermembrane receptor protein